MRERLIELLKELSYERKRVVLASGLESDFYVDGRQTTLNAEGAYLIGHLVHAALKPEVRGVGGLVVGADPISAAVAATSFGLGRPVHAFLVRKEPKGHGMKRHVEGRKNLPDGTAVCMIEDTCTTGGSMLRAIDIAEAEGLRVVQCITIVDREEGAAERLAEAGHTLEVLVRRAELES
ncbi:MAG: orotate phosphoribosyltransferase [Cognaticolwellia sp.]